MIFYNWNITVEIFGWVGSILILGAYFFSLKNWWKTTDYLYIISNVVGGTLLTINTVSHHAYSSSALNFIWVVVAIPNLIKNCRNA